LTPGFGQHQDQRARSIFPANSERRIDEWFFVLPKVFSSCPNLEYLSLKDVSGTCDMNNSVPFAEDLKLKKFYLDGFCPETGGGETWTHFCHFCVFCAVEIVISLFFSEEAIFKNVTKVDLLIEN